MPIPTTPRRFRHLAPKLVLLGAGLTATGVGLDALASTAASAQRPVAAVTAPARAQHDLRSPDRAHAKPSTRAELRTEAPAGHRSAPEVSGVDPRPSDLRPSGTPAAGDR